MIDIIKTPEFKNTIQDSGVGYIVIPNDPERKIFLTDYKFDSSLRNILVDAMNRTSLRPINNFSSLKVYTADHDPMTIQYPENLEAQQYWANIGTAISGISLICIFGFLLYTRK